MNIFDCCSARSGAEQLPELWLSNSTARLAIHNRKPDGERAKFGVKKQPIKLSKTSKSIRSNNCSAIAHNSMRSIQSIPICGMQHVRIQPEVKIINHTPAYHVHVPVQYGVSARNIPAPVTIREVTNQRFFQILPNSNFGQPVPKNNHPHSTKVIMSAIQPVIAPAHNPVPRVDFAPSVERSQKLLPSTKRIHQMEHVDAESLYDEQSSLDQISILDEDFGGPSQRQSNEYGKAHNHEVETNISKCSSIFKSHGI